SAEDMWLNEGWAVWSESLYREGIYGKQAYKQNMRAKLKDVLEMTHIEDGEYYAVSGIPQTITYGNTVYQKGGQVAHTLRGYMGDSLFFGGIKAYLQKYAYNFASSTDLRDFLSIYCGIDLKPFFDAWVFEPGFPHFSVDSVITEKLSKHYDVTVFIRQRLKGRSHYANANHLEITFLDKNWQKITDTIVFSGPAAHKTFHLSFAPVSVMCDINEKISDATTDEVKILKNTGEYNYESSLCKVLVNKVSDSALVRIILNWVAPDSAGDAPKGLRLSDSRFWTVGGIFPKGFKAGGKFIYDRKAGLDNSLISKEGDSLIILYRTGAGHDWQATAFTQQGSWSSGILSVESLKQGEYTLAVWDRKFLQKAGK
ncbi:MAG: M1 family aminopeptidase, partial [Bacteroidota bacterium]